MALYRKYRPATFAEVVGQEHVTDPLSTALDTGRISHAYLFSGPRGCGKTSSARILARSLNCVDGPTSTPCGVCSSCVALGPGGTGNLDVIELDAASHGGVDDTRELRDRAFYAPAESRYRVFIVDEAHMVTNAGFNALLKIVEEPPAHLIFIFATTEPEKVLPTIRSRTHHYPFRLLPPATMRGLLGRICEQENVPVEEAVYPLVIRAGGGSPRDSLSVLDQLLAGAGDAGVTYSRAVALLGVTDVALIDDAVEALAVSDGAALFGTIDRVMEAGHDPRRFAVDLLERLRDLILLRAVPDAAERGLVSGPHDMLERMRDQAQRLGPATLTRFAELLHEGLGEMRGATAPRLLLEVVCARMLLPAASESETATLQRLERLERGLADGTIATGNPGGTSDSSAPSTAASPGTGAAPSGGSQAGRGAQALAAMLREKSENNAGGTAGGDDSGGGGQRISATTDTANSPAGPRESDDVSPSTGASNPVTASDAAGRAAQAVDAAAAESAAGRHGTVSTAVPSGDAGVADSAAQGNESNDVANSAAAVESSGDGPGAITQEHDGIGAANDGAETVREGSAAETTADSPSAPPNGSGGFVADPGVVEGASASNDAGRNNDRNEAAADRQAPERSVLAEGVDAVAESQSQSVGTAASGPAASADAAARIEAAWPEFRAKVREIGGAALHAMLAGASVLRVEAGTVVLAHQHAPLVQRLSTEQNLAAVRTALGAVLGDDAQVRWEVGSAPQRSAPVKAGGARTGGNGQGGERPQSPPRYSRPSQAKNVQADPPGNGQQSNANRDDSASGAVGARQRPAGNRAHAEDEIPPPDYPDLPDDPGPSDYAPPDPAGGYDSGDPWASARPVAPETPEEERELLAEAADPVAPGDRRDPDEVAMELLKSELGATRLDG